MNFVSCVLNLVITLIIPITWKKENVHSLYVDTDPQNDGRSESPVTGDQYFLLWTKLYASCQ